MIMSLLLILVRCVTANLYTFANFTNLVRIISTKVKQKLLFIFFIGSLALNEYYVKKISKNIVKLINASTNIVYMTIITGRYFSVTQFFIFIFKILP